jgi:bacteriophage N4 adsorption protein A
MRTAVIRTCASAAIVAAALTLATPLRAADAADGPDQFDLGGDVSGYRRFLIYPHLQKGVESLRRGDHTRALAEFERARELAPENAVVALHLADAYRRFGDIARAETVLRKQLEQTPADERVREALNRLHPATTDAPQSAAVSACDNPGCKGSTAAIAPAMAASTAATVSPAAATAAKPASTSSRRQQPVPQRAYAGKSKDSPLRSVSTDDVDPTAPFIESLLAQHFDDAQHQAIVLLSQTADNGAMLDEFSYRLAEAGAAPQAVRVLFTAFPFTSSPDAERELLTRRLLVIASEQPAALTEEDFARLRVPLDTPVLRSAQSILWAGRRDCDGVRQVLGDMSSLYGYDDWMRLGDCTVTDAPNVALNAYATAHERQPGGIASRAFAYQAYATGDMVKAMSAWRSLDDNLMGEDWLAASTTALAAGEHMQAAAWILRYRDTGNPLNYRYWSLVAQISLAREDTSSALVAYDQAVTLQPNVDDYWRLALLQTDLSRQISLLERAVQLDGNSVMAQAQLGFAYRRAGRDLDAEAALQRARTLDPENVNVQLALGFLYFDLGLMHHARQALEAGWQTDRSKTIAAEQLVYVYQRLHDNTQARWYAEQVLDAAATAPSNTQTTGEVRTRHFGLQRLHEDLGRRVTVNFDGYTGTSLGTGTSASQAGNRYSSYSQLEADVRLGRQPVRDGSTVSAYARVIGDGGVERNAWPSQHPTLGVGLRWKPWRNQIIYFAGENQTSLDDSARNEFLLRTSASFFNGGRFGDDWHAARKGWFSQNLYLDAAHYLKADQSAMTADYRNSYHVKLGSAMSLEPYGHFQVNGLRNGEFARDIRAGVGSRWNVWYGANRYDAPPHKLSIGLEFQQAFETYLPDRNGVFLSVNSRW